MNINRCFIGFLFGLLWISNSMQGQSKLVFIEPQILETIVVDSVWAANTVNFDLYTVKNKQYIAYYNKDRNMTVACRTIGSNLWEKKILPNKLVWDSHNSVVLGFDEAGYIHVSGNMHSVPLIYFRSQKPYDIQSLVPVHEMTKTEEKRVTYPAFFNDKEGKLYYSYRSGGSGDGTTFVNRFDSKNLKWESLVQKGLFDGRSGADSRSAYHSLNKDNAGNYCATWMWRWTPLVETCHQLCYVTSSDLIHWKNAFGQDVELPLRPDTKSIIVDDVPTKGGLHNGKYKTIFTDDNKPLICYTKYDEQGFSQLYIAKTVEQKWISKKISNWDYRHEFVGGGDKMSVGPQFEILSVLEPGIIAIDWKLPTNKSGIYVLDSNTLEIVDKKVTILSNDIAPLADKQEKKLKINNVIKGKAIESSKQEQYRLSWQTAARSHGSSAPAVIPNGPISVLYLLKIEKK